MLASCTDETCLIPFLSNQEDFKRLVRGVPLRELQSLKGAYKHKNTRYLLTIALSKEVFGRRASTWALIHKWIQANAPLLQALQSVTVDGVPIKQGDVSDDSITTEPLRLTGEEVIAHLLSYVEVSKPEEREKVYCSLLLDPRENVRNLIADWGKAILDGEDTLIKKADTYRVYVELERLRTEDEAHRAQLKELEEEVDSVRDELDNERRVRGEVERQLSLEKAAEFDLREEVDVLKSQLQLVKMESSTTIEELRVELEKVRKQLESEQRFPRVALNPQYLSESWQDAVSIISSELTFLVHEESDPSSLSMEAVTPPHSREADWLRWQDKERSLVESVLWGGAQIKGHDLDRLGEAQHLLELRWYLLHGLRTQMLKELSQLGASSFKKRRK